MKSIDLKSGVPKYRQLTDYFLQEIRSGNIRVGECLPSFAELRAELGISQATFDKVHRLLEKEGLVSRERGRGSFVLDPSRETAPPARRHVLAYLQPHSDVFQGHAYFSDLLRGVREAAHRYNENVLLVSQPENFDKWTAVDGVMLCLDVAEADNIMPDIPEGFPAVSPLYPIPGYSCVQGDEETGLSAAVRHLLELGHRRIAYFGQIHKAGLKPRLRGYHKTLAEFGIDIGEGWLLETENCWPTYENENNIIEDGRLNMQRWLESGWPKTGCTAILAQNDLTAFGVIRALQGAGQRVPQDVSVVGFDGLEHHALAPITLTTVRVPLRDIGARTVEILMDGLGDPEEAPRTIQLPCPLVIGESTAPPRKA